MRTFGAVQGREWSHTLGYGLGLMRETLRSGDSAIVANGHTGWLNGYRIALWYDPERQIAVVAMQNLDSANPTPLAAEALAIARIVTR
jgi:CubicO group peptidase (beta-lactamase class C family)